LSTPKNKVLFRKINFNNIDGREREKSAVQRFATDKSNQNPESDNAVFTGRSGNNGRIGNIDILGIFKKSDNDSAYNNTDTDIDTEIEIENSDYSDYDDEPVSFVNLQYDEEPEDISIEDRVDNLHFQVQKIESQFERLENKINKIETPHINLNKSAETEPAVKPEEPQNIQDRPEIPEPDSRNFDSYFFKNTMERVVIEEVATTMKHTANICKCGKCFYDICAIALNNIPSHYATTEQGELMQKAHTILNIENLSKISTEIFKAIDIVRNYPSH